MIDLPDPQSSESVADWVELQLTLGNKKMSRGEVSSAIEAASGFEPSDAFLSDVWRELSRRQGLYALHLFSVKGLGVSATTSKKTIVTAAYKACLFLSLYGVHDQKVSKLFERVTCCAVEQYLNGKAAVWGWDGTGNIGARMQKLADILGERFSYPPPAHYKDRGVDVVGWKPFPDSRSGQIVLLAQCAAGFDWRTKRPVPIGAWCQHIHWAAPPGVAFAVPRIVSPTDWHDRSVDLGLLLDRARLVNLLADGCSDSSLEKDLSLWIKDQLSMYDA
jgi:hypothetical protein